jgi:flavoprotein
MVFTEEEIEKMAKELAEMTRKEHNICKCCDNKVCKVDWMCHCKCYGCGKTDLCPKDSRLEGLEEFLEKIRNDRKNKK